MEASGHAVTYSDVVLTLSPEEAKKLRRTCYYNLTVRDRFVTNPNGGIDKAEQLCNFLSELGNKLAALGVERF